MSDTYIPPDKEADPESDERRTQHRAEGRHSRLVSDELVAGEALHGEAPLVAGLFRDRRG